MIIATTTITAKEIQTFVLMEDAFVELMGRDVQRRIQRVIIQLEFANAGQERINGEDLTKDAFLAKSAL